MSKTKTQTQSCPACGGVMRYETRPDVLTYKGHEKTVDTLAWWCTKCDEAILTGEPLVAQEKAYLELKAEVDEVLSPAEVKAAREKLGLSQRRASEILGGGPRSFQKYEAGTQAVSTPMSHLLRLLSNDVSRLKELTKPEGTFSKYERLDPMGSRPSLRTTKARERKVRNAKAAS